MGVVTEAFHDGVCHLTLNRPDKKNAMSEELLEALYHSLQKAEKEGASIIVIRGSERPSAPGAT